MNKKLIAAIAATTMAGAIGFASVASAEATFYGRVVAGAVYNNQDDGENPSAWNLGATDIDGGGNAHSRFGFKGSKDLGNGMKAGFKLEREIRGEKDINQRHNLVYLSGAWGKLTLGNQSNPYMNARNWDQTNLFGGNYGEDYRHEGVGYSMSTGNFSLNILAIGNDANVDAAGGVGGTTTTCMGCNSGSMITTVGTPKVSGGDSVDAWIIHVGYDFGPIALNVAHHTDNKDVDLARASLNAVTNSTASLVADETAAETAALATFNNINAGLVDAAASRDRTAIGINGTVGSLDWYLAYNSTELNSNSYSNDVDSVGGYLGFSISEADTIYGYYVSHEADRPTYSAPTEDDVGGTITRGTDYTETIFGYSHSFGPGVKFIAEYAKFDADLAKNGEPDKIFLGIKYDF